MTLLKTSDNFMKKEISSSHLGLKGLARLFGRGAGRRMDRYLSPIRWGNLSTAGVTTKSLYHICEFSQGEKISCAFTRTVLLFQGKGLSTVYLKKTISCLKSADSLLPDHSLEYNI